MRDATKRRRGRPLNDTPLVVWSERRDPPDWDRFIAALVSFSLDEVERQGPEILRLTRVLRRVAERKSPEQPTKFRMPLSVRE